MLGFRSLLKRINYRNSSSLAKGANPLVECETAVKNNTCKHVKEIHINKFIDNYRTYSEIKPIQIEYFEKDKIYTVIIHLSK